MGIMNGKRRGRSKIRGKGKGKEKDKGKGKKNGRGRKGKENNFSITEKGMGKKTFLKYLIVCHDLEADLSAEEARTPASVLPGRAGHPGSSTSWTHQVRTFFHSRIYRIPFAHLLFDIRVFFCVIDLWLKCCTYFIIS